MRRFFFISIAILSLGILGLFMYSGNKEGEPVFYSPLEGRGYVTGSERYLSFDIYSLNQDSMITDEEKNSYTLKTESLTLVLDNVSVSAFDLGDYQLIRVKGDLPDVTGDVFSSSSSSLIIKNSRYTVTLEYGPISILREDSHPLLSVSELYGSYSYMNGVLLMSGINLTLDKEYEYLTELHVGNTGCGVLSKALFDIREENVFVIRDVIPSYNPSRVEEGYTLSLRSETMFIPISYSSLSLLRESYLTLTLDGITYYLDQFQFMTNAYDFKEYESMMQKGVVSYA